MWRRRPPEATHLHNVPHSVAARGLCLRTARSPVCGVQPTLSRSLVEAFCRLTSMAAATPAEAVAAGAPTGAKAYVAAARVPTGRPQAVAVDVVAAGTPALMPSRSTP